MRKLVCGLRSLPHSPRSASIHVRNKSDESNHVETSVFTPETISGKKFQRLTKEKASVAREIDKGKTCLNFAWLKENVSVLISWEGKTEEHSMCVGNCIDSDSVWFSAKGALYVVCVPIWPVTVPIGSVTVPKWLGPVHLARRGFQHCIEYCLLPPMLVYFAVLQPGLFLASCLIHSKTTRTTFSELP